MDTFWMLIHAPFPVLSFIPLSIIHSWPILLFFSCRERLRGSTTRFPHHKIPLLIFPFSLYYIFLSVCPFFFIDTLWRLRNSSSGAQLLSYSFSHCHSARRFSQVFFHFCFVFHWDFFFFSCITTYGKSSCWKDQQLLPLMHSCAMCMQLIHLMMNTESHAKWFQSYTTASVPNQDVGMPLSFKDFFASFS